MNTYQTHKSMARCEQIVERGLVKYSSGRSDDWGEDELLHFSKDDFLEKFNVSPEEYDMLQKDFQEM